MQTEELTVGKYFSNIWNAVITTMKGMKVTIKYLGVKEVTLQYPEEREVLPENNRSRLYNNVDDCTACSQCANICPVGCIYLASTRRAADAPPKKASNGMPIRMELTQYVIDEALCCYCGLCTTVCPTNCIFHTTDFEYSKYKLDDMKYDYLDPEVRAWKDRLVKVK